MSMICKEKSYKFSKILEKYLANSFLPLSKKACLYYIEAFGLLEIILKKQRKYIKIT